MYLNTESMCDTNVKPATRQCNRNTRLPARTDAPCIATSKNYQLAIPVFLNTAADSTDIE